VTPRGAAPRGTARKRLQTRENWLAHFFEMLRMIRNQRMLW
jgi:hypothetical protein